MAAPVEAWRFDVVTPGGELRSPFEDAAIGSRRMDAVCETGHVPPAPHCVCGVYGAAAFDGLAYEFRAKWGSVSPFTHPVMAGRPEPLPPDERVGDPAEAIRRIVANARRWWTLSQVTLYHAVEYREVQELHHGTHLAWRARAAQIQAIFVTNADVVGHMRYRYYVPVTYVGERFTADLVRDLIAERTPRTTLPRPRDEPKPDVVELPPRPRDGSV